jgi:hypothetical protein
MIYRRKLLQRAYDSTQPRGATPGWRCNAKHFFSRSSSLSGTGTNLLKSELRLITAARPGEIDVRLVWRLEGLDLTTPTGRAMAGLLPVFAAVEHEPSAHGFERALPSGSCGESIRAGPVAVGKSQPNQETTRAGVSKAEIAGPREISAPPCAEF